MGVHDKFGKHEVLDRTHLLVEQVSNQLLDHGGLKPDELKLAGDAVALLADLYQLIGRNNHG